MMASQTRSLELERIVVYMSLLTRAIDFWNFWKTFQVQVVVFVPCFLPGSALFHPVACEKLMMDYISIPRKTK